MDKFREDLVINIGMIIVLTIVLLVLLIGCQSPVIKPPIVEACEGNYTSNTKLLYLVSNNWLNEVVTGVTYRGKHIHIMPLHYDDPIDRYYWGFDLGDRFLDILSITPAHTQYRIRDKVTGDILETGDKLDGLVIIDTEICNLRSLTR